MKNWFLRFCFTVTWKELSRWYKKNEESLTHWEWRDNHQVITYLKKHIKTRFKGKKEEGSKRPSSKNLR